MCVWNVQGLNSKDEDLIDEFEKSKLKGQGCLNMKSEHIHIYSCIDEKKRVR